MKIELPEHKQLVFEMTIPIRWGDMDAMGHINNAVYFRYMETARIDWLHGIGCQPDPGGEGEVIVNAPPAAPPWCGATFRRRNRPRCPTGCASASAPPPAVDGAGALAVHRAQSNDSLKIRSSAEFSAPAWPRSDQRRDSS